MEVQHTHPGASAYVTPAFEPEGIAAPAPSFFQRAAAWLTRPLFTLDLAVVELEEEDPTEFMRESMRQSSDEMLDMRIGPMNTTPDDD